MFSEQRTIQQIPPEATRLVVLVPLMDIKPVYLSKRITDLAGNRIHQVTYVVVPHILYEELMLTSLLHRLVSATHSDRLHVDVQSEYGTTWQKAIRKNLQPGDVVVCPEGYAVQWRRLWHRLLQEVLSEKIDAPLYILNYQDHTSPSEQVSKNHRYKAF